MVGGHKGEGRGRGLRGWVSMGAMASFLVMAKIVCLPTLRLNMGYIIFMILKKVSLALI